jgi:hypothetical protein
MLLRNYKDEDMSLIFIDEVNAMDLVQNFFSWWDSENPDEDPIYYQVYFSFNKTFSVN